MRRIYVETSVWSMVGDLQPKILKDPTLEFLEQCAARVHAAYVSPVVVEELQQAPANVQGNLLNMFERINPYRLDIPSNADELARRFISEGILGSQRIDDARHVACAMAHDLDLLVSWNYRHIANVRKSERFNAVAVLAGFRGGLEIHTPMEVIEWT